MKGETQRQIKSFLAEGLSNKEITDRLPISERMVKWHVSNLYAAYGLHGLADHRRLIVLLVTEKLKREKGTDDEADRRNGQLVHAGVPG